MKMALGGIDPGSGQIVRSLIEHLAFDSTLKSKTEQSAMATQNRI
jgi:hypothetical protein